MLRSILRVTFWLHQIKFFTIFVSGVGGGGPLPPPLLGFKVSITRQNFEQFHIFRAILLSNYFFFMAVR